MKTAILLAMLAGLAVALQTGFNAGAQKVMGPFLLIAISGSATALVGLLVFLFVSKPQVTGQAVGYALTSGALGAVIVGSISVAATQGGVARALSLVIGTQLVVSLVLDRFGFFSAGAELSLLKVLGVLLILIGGILVVRY